MHYNEANSLDQGLLWRIDDLCERFEAEWQAQRRPQIADYLTDWSEPESQVLFRFLLELELDFRRAAGEACQAVEYQRQFPQFEQAIADLFGKFDENGDTGPTAGLSTNPSPPHAGRGRTRLPLPASWGDYELLEFLGEGGMGLVYRARQKSLNRLVAVKMIRTGEFASLHEMQRFRAEAEAAAQLEHPGIVPVYHVGNESGQLFFSMGLVEGGNLAERAARGPMETAEAARYLLHVARAVHYAHSRGIIHRDLKPANILLDSFGQPRVTDFGLAKWTEQNSGLTMTGQVLGTPSYMPPEQARGDCSAMSPRSDIYSLGAILYRLITGRAPFQGSCVVETLYQVVHDEVVSPRKFAPAIPADLDTICLKCLEKSPARRYESAEELAEELQRFLNDEPIVARPLGPTTRMWRWCRRNRALSGALATAFLVLLLATTVSSYFAVVAWQRSVTLAAVNQDLVEANRKSTKSAEEARTSADLAARQSEVTLRTLESLLFDVQTMLETLPAAQNVRREMLNTVVDSLSNVATSLRSSRRVTRSHAVLELNLADVYRQVSNERGEVGATAALEHYERAIELFEELRDQDLSNRVAGLDLADAYERCGDCLTESDQQRRSATLLGKAIILRRDLAAALPQDEESQLALCRVLTDWGYAEMAGGDRPAARHALEESNKLAGDLVQRQPDHGEYLRAYGDSCKLLGDWHFDFGDDADAEPLFHEMLAKTRRRAELLPDDYDALMEYSAAYERFGNLYEKRKEFDKSLEAHEAALTIAEQLLERSPNNAYTQLDVAVSYDKVAKLSLALGNLPRAEETARRAFELRLPITKADPLNAKVLRYFGGPLLGTVYERLFEFELAAENYRQTLQPLQQFNERTGTQRFAKAIESLTERIANCDCAVRCNESLAFARGQADAKKWLGVRFEVCLKRGDRQAAQATAAAMEELDHSPGHLYQVARLYGRCAAGDKTIESHERSITAGCQTLHRAIDAGFDQFEQLRTDPALAPLRHASEFQQLLARLDQTSDE